MLQLQLLRLPQVLLADGSPRPLNAVDAGLLALLALDGASSRARLGALLWPDVPAEVARNNLRQRVFRLKKLLGEHLVASADVVALAATMPRDVHGPEATLIADPDALAGELLEGHDHDALRGELADWLRSARARWRAERRDALVRIASRHEEANRIPEALPYAERLVRDEPLLEDAHRRLMRLHYRNGDHGAARAAHAALRRSLGADAPLSPDTQAIIALLRQAVPLPQAAPARPVGLLRPPRLVGRAQAWQQLDGAWAAHAAVLVLGEPGIGKTRLLSDFVAAKGAVLIPSRPGDARVPFALLARLVRRLVRVEPGRDPAAAAPPLAAWALPELAHLVPELGVMPAAPPQPLRLQRAVAHAVAAGGLAGVALDDLQFADEATLEMLPALVHAADGARWLLASRTGEQPAALRAGPAALDAPLLARVELGPLDRQGVAEMLASLALPGIEAQHWAERIHRHTGGNPLFILETLLAMQGSTASATLPLPGHLHVLIERRLSQLSEDALKLARVAALAAQDFDIELAAAVLGRHALDLSDPWRELERAQVLQGNAFAHDLIFEVTRETMPGPIRQWLHRRIGQALELRTGAAARLAHHWREAHEPARAAANYMKAADAARAIGRLSEESRWLDAAAESFAAAGDANWRFEALRRLAASALEALSPTDAANAARALHAAASGDRQLGIAHRQLGACQMNAARFELATAELDRAISHSAAAGDVDNANHARYLRVMAQAQGHGLAQAMAAMEALLPWAESLHDDTLRHEFLGDLAILCDQADQRRRARPHFERALAYFDRQHQTGNAATCRMMYARSMTMLGELDAARSLYEAALRDRDELSEGEGASGIEALNLGRLYCELGHYDRVLQLLEPSHERLVRHGLGVVGAATALVLARTYAHLGQRARGLACLKGLPEDLPYHQRASVLWTRAWLAWERPADRRTLLAQALAEFTSADLPFLRLPFALDALACGPADAAAIARCRALIAECGERELLAAQVLGRMRLVQLLGAAGAADTALAEARALVAALAQTMPLGTYLPELHWSAHLAARAAGDDGFAVACLNAARRWIAEVHAAHVPAPFRDSFLHRNPLNRGILVAQL